MRWIWWTVLAACAAPQQQYSYQTPRGPERALAPVTAKVVSADEAERSGLAARTLTIPFAAPADGTKLVADYLARADAAKATFVADLAIYLQTTVDSRATECRSDIVPETITATVEHPSHYELVSVSKPVQRMVTDYEYRCHPVMSYEQRPHTEYEQKCGSVSKPVQRTRTVYRSEYDSFSKSYRSVPQTEYYTAYESQYECKSEPVTRYRSESVSKTECRSEPVTHMVTRYEYQLDNQYVPARFEQITRQRLRELDPVCYALDGNASGPPATTPQNRIEGRIFAKLK